MSTSTNVETGNSTEPTSFDTLEINEDTLILNWTPVFHELIWENYRIDYCGKDIPPCLITHNRSHLNSSNLLVFHAWDVDVNLIDLPDKETINKFGNKIPWVYYSAEVPGHKWEFEDDKMEMFEFSLTYRLDSDFSSSYFAENLIEIVKAPLRHSFNDRKKVPVAWIVSNCRAKNGRHYYVKELSKYIDIDIYGNCLNNTLFPEPQITLPELISQYKFYIAVENSNCDYYVTEKLLNAFLAGVVPIVDGPSDYSPFEPTNHSLIRLDQFSSPLELATYLISLSSDKDAYLSYLSYKNGEPLSPKFLKYWKGYNNTNGVFGYDFQGARCKMCKLANQLKYSKNNDLENTIFGNESIPKKKLHADLSCIYGKHDEFWSPFWNNDIQFIYLTYFLLLIFAGGFCFWIFKVLMGRNRKGWRKVNNNVEDPN